MKRILLITAAFMLLATLALQAQITINGTLQYSNGTPVPNHTITLLSGTVTSQVTTDVNGQYIDTLQVNTPAGGVSFTYLDCNGFQAMDSAFFQLNPSTITVTHQYCLSAPPSGCSSAFSIQSNPSNNLYQFNPDSLLASSSYTFNWSLSNGQVFTTSNPSVQGLTPGNYTMCLTLTNTSLGCVDTTCLTFVVGGQTGNAFTGTIFQGNSTATDATVFLIRADSTTTGLLLTAVDSIAVTQGTYSFTNVVPGTYYIKAALNPSNVDFWNYLPTYSDSSTVWSGAMLYMPNSSSTITANVWLVQGNNNGGPAFIGGLVAQGANKMEGVGDPINGAQVVVYNQNGTPVSWALSEPDGSFEIPNLPYGTYEIHAEIPGLTTNRMTVTLDPNTPSFTNILVEVNSETIDITGTSTGISEKTRRNFDAYPNPTTGQLTLIWEEPLAKDRIMMVYDLAGNLFLKQLVNKNTRQTSIDVSRLSAGVYLLVGGQTVQRITIIN